MRLFIAIQFDNSILDELERYQAELRQQSVTGNYTSRENLHITLAFIGEFGDPDAVIEAMEQADFKPFEISLGKVGSFEDLLWMGVEENPQLEAFVKRLRRALADAWISFDRKRFSPHITLIRRYANRGGKSIPVTCLPKGTMKVTHISLMRSERGKRGMIYTEIGGVE